MLAHEADPLDDDVERAVAEHAPYRLRVANVGPKDLGARRRSVTARLPSAEEREVDAAREHLTSTRGADDARAADEEDVHRGADSTLR